MQKKSNIYAICEGELTQEWHQSLQKHFNQHGKKQSTIHNTTVQPVACQVVTQPNHIYKLYVQQNSFNPALMGTGQVPDYKIFQIIRCSQPSDNIHFSITFISSRFFSYHESSHVFFLQNILL